MFGKRNKKPMFSKVRWGLSILFGATVGLLVAPKKGKDLRQYLKSDTFKGKMNAAGSKGMATLKTLKKGTTGFASGLHKLIKKTRARFGK